jgi:CRP-like cAMP-binding protein
MFGTTESVLKHVLDVIKDADYFILDLKHVFEIDRSACQLLEKLSEAVIKSEKRMYFTYTTNKYGFRRYMKNHLGEIVEKLFQYDDTDHALERCEDVIIESLHLLNTESLSVDLSDQDLCIGLDDAEIEKLRAIVKPVTYEAGEKIFKCGDDARSLYMIQQGEAEVLLPTSSGQTIRLAMLSPGMYFGEMALLNHRTRSADVRTTRKSSLYEIVFEDIPDEIRYSLIANFAQLLAKKLGRETQELKHLD